jgi:hypothetical protein
VFFSQRPASAARPPDAVVGLAEPSLQFLETAPDRRSARARNPRHSDDAAMSLAEGQQPGGQAALAFVEADDDAVDRRVVACDLLKRGRLATEALALVRVAREVVCHDGRLL